MAELLLEITAIKRQKADTGWFCGRARAVPDPEAQRDLDFRGELPIVGVWPDVTEGIPFLVEADFEEDPTWGRQIQLGRGRARARRVERLISRDGVSRYLNTIKKRLDTQREAAGLTGLGIGGGRLDALVQAFGTNAPTIARTDPARVAAEVKGWSSEQAQAFAAVLEEHVDEEKARLELATIGAGALSTRQQEELIAKFKLSAPEKLRQDPYRWIDEDEEGWALDGYGWRKADTIAVKNLRWNPSLPARVRASLVEALRDAARDGDCYLTRAEIITRAAALSGLPPLYAGRILDLCTEVLEDDPGGGSEPRVYLASIRRAEITVANLAERAASIHRRHAPPHSEDSRIVEGLNAEQRLAFELAVGGGISVVTGGPGRGKTHTCRAVIRALQLRGRRVAIVAPTGRAAARASELTGERAMTIHRALAEWREADGLPFTDLIIDECSMIDVQLLARLVRFIEARARAGFPNILMVGDADQLAPVGPGKPFLELVEAGVAPVVRLERVMRTDRRALIEAGNAVNGGGSQGSARLAALAEADPDHALIYIRSNDARESREILLARVEGMVESGIPPADIQVIVGRNGYRDAGKGEEGTAPPLSTRDLNRPLGKILNPNGAPTGIFANGDELRLGDRVMQLKNERLKAADADPDRSGQRKDPYVANGELGQVIDVLSADADGTLGARVVIDFGMDGMRNPRVVAVTSKNHLVLAWASTCHKFQGSEAKHVLLAFDRSSGRLADRSWLYTGITRAALTLTLIAPSRLIDSAISRQPAARLRRTGLRDLLRQVKQTAEKAAIEFSEKFGS
jgi:exodeoxyribonuclease V alpha subunit